MVDHIKMQGQVAFPVPHLWFNGFAQQAAVMQVSVHWSVPTVNCFARMFRRFSDPAHNPGESCEETENGSSVAHDPSHKSVSETRTFPAPTGLPSPCLTSSTSCILGLRPHLCCMKPSAMLEYCMRAPMFLFSTFPCRWAVPLHGTSDTTQTKQLCWTRMGHQHRGSTAGLSFLESARRGCTSTLRLL